MQKRQLSRRGFLSLAGATGGAALLAACAPAEVEVDQPAAADDSGEAMPDVERVPVRVWIGGSYTPTEWTSRSAEHPIVVNAPRILAERYHEENPGTEIVYEEGPGGRGLFRLAHGRSNRGHGAQSGAQHTQFCRPERLGSTYGRLSGPAQPIRAGL